MTAFVTGGTGFLGRRLVGRLLAEGVRVRCLLRPQSNGDALLRAAAGASGCLEVVRGSLEWLAASPESLDGCDVVYHVAAEMRGATAALFAGNVVGTRSLIDAARRAWVGRFVLVSSAGVYGTQHLPRWGTVDEDCPLDPEPHRRDPYSYSKVVQERVAWEARREHGLPLAVVRPGVIYGPERDCLSGRVGVQVGGWMIRMGGGQPLPYTFVENCAEAVRLAGTASGAEGHAFNIVDDDPPTAAQLFRRHRSAVGTVRGIPVPAWLISPLSAACEWYHRRSAGQLPAVLTHYKSRAMWRPLRYSNAKAKAVLGWRPEVDFESGLSQTFASLKEVRRPSERATA